MIAREFSIQVNPCFPAAKRDPALPAASPAFGKEVRHE